jgi:ribosomal protein L7/L12
MSDYAPIYFPADRLPRTTSATVTKGQLLYVSGVDTVAPTSAATGAWIGVAAHDAASGAQVVVYTEGVHEVAASGSITAGDNVVAGGAGAVATQGTPSAANDVQVVGVALNTAASSKVTVLIR